MSQPPPASTDGSPSTSVKKAREASASRANKMEWTASIMRSIFTVGHSTHSLEAFVALLRRHGVELVVDVRAFPRSRRHPWFDAEALATELPVAYRHLRALGGRRRVRPGSPNAGWDVAGFQAFADHALTPEFASALDELTSLARDTPTAIMCAEGMWWRCHRRLIADRLVAMGWTVRHIEPGGGLAEHAFPPFAAPQPDGTVLYPPPGTLFDGA
jgi:uncharacterized protein (DUF488 family)